jgi:hypothetical protein
VEQDSTAHTAESFIDSAHKNLSNIDYLMACTVSLVCFISTVNGCSEKKENALEDVALVAGTQQNLSNLYSLDICGSALA